MDRMDPNELMAELDFARAGGLVAAIAVDDANGEVLMVAWMNEDSLRKTFELGEAVYWSRSRSELWHKGATSGHIQKVKSLSIDCDGDAVLLRVEQEGGACHTGRLFALAIRHGLTAEDLKDVIFAYPTHASDVGYMV